MEDAARTETVELHEIKGVLAKFMRMLHPLEFRIDTLEQADPRPIAPFRYPFSAGNMVYLPARIEAPARQINAYDYYVLAAAHLAGRHEFGSYRLRLGELEGFAGRSEEGCGALEAFCASFADSRLAAGLLRLCESARIEACLARRYPGLATRLGQLARLLAGHGHSRSLGALLLGAASATPPEDGGQAQALHARLLSWFVPLKLPEATVAISARQAAALYRWLAPLLAAADPALLGEAAQASDPAALASGLAGELGAVGAGAGADMTADPLAGPGENAASGLPDQHLQPKLEAGMGDKSAIARRSLQQPAADGDGDAGALDRGSAQRLRPETLALLAPGAEDLRRLKEQLSELAPSFNVVYRSAGAGADSYYAYDEWDYTLADYRHNWCRLREIALAGDQGDFFTHTLERYGSVLSQVRRHFQRIRPASYRMVRGLEDGEEIDFDRVVEAWADRHMGGSPDARLYRARKKEMRDIATLFLLDMSASTDEPMRREAEHGRPPSPAADAWMKPWLAGGKPPGRPRRVIDVNKEALVIMAQALEGLGDSYAIMGFSGHGRDNVEFYIIKDFNDPLSDAVRGRIGAVEPKRSTRMGAALRHAREKFRPVTARAKHVILLSDGFPQDYDYGHDRRSNAYGVQDTMVALRELELAGITPFCITVDRAGHDYLRRMCRASQYLVLEDIESLPLELPKVYQQVVRW